MRIGILGVGAIGGVIGGYLARAGRDVTLIDMWPANVDRIKADGLKVTTIEGVFTVEAPGPPPVGGLHGAAELRHSHPRHEVLRHPVGDHLPAAVPGARRLHRVGPERDQRGRHR